MFVETITPRGLSNEVLREYQISNGQEWDWTKDYIYAGDKLLASEAPGTNGTRHYHLDHLGTTRVISNHLGNAINEEPYQYFPFGDEATAAPPADEKLRFTGHQRDTSDPFQLDYMHARYYFRGGSAGKFMSVDPGRDWDPQEPQSWNSYAYVRNNPVGATDPTGRCSSPKIGSGQVGICLQAFIAAATINGVGFGNNRGFSADNPKLDAKVTVMIAVDTKTGKVSASHQMEASMVMIPGVLPGIPPQVRTKEATGFVNVTSSKDGANYNVNVRYEAWNGWAEYPLAPNWPISADINFTVTPDGRVGVKGGTLDGYPSTEAYAYPFGGKPRTLIRIPERHPDDLEPPREVKLAPKPPQ